MAPKYIIPRKSETNKTKLLWDSAALEDPFGVVVCTATPAPSEVVSFDIVEKDPLAAVAGFVLIEGFADTDCEGEATWTPADAHSCLVKAWTSVYEHLD